MCIHKRRSAPKRFAQFGRQKQTLCKKMEGKYGQPSLDHTDYSQSLEDVRRLLSRYATIRRLTTIAKRARLSLIVVGGQQVEIT